MGEHFQSSVQGASGKPLLNVKTTASDAVEIREWQKAQQQVATEQELLQLGWRAFRVALKSGASTVAEEIVDSCLAIARKHVLDLAETAQSLRTLSIFLNQKGTLENALGRREAAYELYQESLKIRRRLLETLGETPESLRDLSVSLNNIGNQEVELGKEEAAYDSFSECLRYLKRLSAASPEANEYTMLITDIESWIKQQGDG